MQMPWEKVRSARIVDALYAGWLRAAEADYATLATLAQTEAQADQAHAIGQKILGDVKGAKAGITTKRRRADMTVAAVVAFGPLGLAALASGQAVAYIAFSDGTLHETAVKGNKDLRQAELDVARFNAAAEPDGEVGRFNALAGRAPTSY